MIFGALLLIAAIAAPPSLAVPAPAVAGSKPVVAAQREARTSGSLSERLSKLRSEVIRLEEDLLRSARSERDAKANVRKIQALIKLQREERQLSEKRMGELEKTVGELESRRNVLNERIQKHQKVVRGYLIAVEASIRESRRGPTDGISALQLSEREKLQAPRRKLLANLVGNGLKEVEALRADLADADRLEDRIEDEKQALAYLFQDLKEQESVLELNRQLQVDLLRKRHEEKIAQLENYRELKSAEAQVASLIAQFNARIELEKATERERQVNRAMADGVFARLKGKLPYPVSGATVVSAFGRAFDPRSKLHVFKKGVELLSAKGAPVKAISAGKLAYSGELPGYGRVAIVDHGDHFYSLCAHLGQLTLKAGDSVGAGEVIGVTDDLGTPVYFEIRARNLPVNPLQWVTN